MTYIRMEIVKLMAQKMMRIEIPQNYEFENLEECVAELGEETILEAVKRYFDYASANKKYRENKQQVEKATKAALVAAGVDVQKLIAEALAKKEVK